MNDDNTAVVLVSDVRLSITNASEHRRLLLDAMVALVEGRLNVSQANALSSLSTEVHKSIRLEFDILSYAAKNFRIGEGNQLKQIGPPITSDHTDVE